MVRGALIQLAPDKIRKHQNRRLEHGKVNEEPDEVLEQHRNSEEWTSKVECSNKNNAKHKAEGLLAKIPVIGNLGNHHG